MRCIFCKTDSSEETAIEHIVPESLGNIDHLLSAGVVCLRCNQYFARKIERPLLESGIFKFLRADRGIPNKRGRFPSVNAGEESELPEFRVMSRFVGKVALETLASKTKRVANGNAEIVDHDSLDPLREYVRFNKGNTWPLHYRTIYPVNAVFREKDEWYEILHEYDLLYTPSKELYGVVVILGVEFVINFGGANLDGYVNWLGNHDQMSPLYSKIHE